MSDDPRARLRAALTGAMKQRDTVAVTALRSTLSAIDNAEAITVVETPTSVVSGPIAGATTGLGRTEAERRELSAADVDAIVRAQVADREEAAAEYDRLDRPDEATRLRAEAAVLRATTGC